MITGILCNLCLKIINALIMMGTPLFYLAKRLTLMKRLLCLFLFVASTMQATAGAMAPMSNMMQSHVAEQSTMTDAQQAHCREMMNNGSMSMSMNMDMTMDCASDCECCSGVCATPLVFIDYHHNLSYDPLSNNAISLRVNQPIRVITSLYRPPINA
jgi:hypothetical protein